MASITGYIRTITSSRRVTASSPSRVVFNGDYVPASTGSPGIIQPVGIIPVGGGVDEDLGTDVLHHFIGNSALSTSVTTGALAEYSVAADAASEENLGSWIIDYDGNTVYPAAYPKGITLSCKASSLTHDSHMEARIYHEDSVGGDTLLDEVVFDTLTTSYAAYVETWTPDFEQYFDTDERIYVKVVFVNEGEPV